MSFEDLEVARAARAAKEVLKGKGKRGRKRKETALEAEEVDPEPGLGLAAKEAIRGREKPVGIVRALRKTQMSQSQKRRG